MKWILLKITATVEHQDKGTLTFDFEPREFIIQNNDEVFDTISMKEFIDMIGEKVAREE